MVHHTTVTTRHSESGSFFVRRFIGSLLLRNLRDSVCNWLISFACCGVDPEAYSTWDGCIFFYYFYYGVRSVVISLLVPVTPRLDTMYKNPLLFCNHSIRSSEVRQWKDIRSTLYLSATSRNSFFSSKGISGSIIPSMPTSLHLEKFFGAVLSTTLA